MSQEKACIKCGLIPDPIPSRWKRYDFTCNKCAYKRSKERLSIPGQRQRLRESQKRNYWKRRRHNPKHLAYEKEFEKRRWQNRKNDSAFKASRATYQREYRKRIGEQTKAYQVTQQAIKKGNLVRLPCLNCGDPKSQGHHPDYKKPLEVLCLCDSHHKLIHQQLRRAS